MTRFLAALIVIYMLVAAFSEAFAQDGAHTHPAYEQALKERKDVDSAIGQEIIDLKIQVNENLSSIVGLEDQVSEILLRLEALEQTGSGEPVDPPVEPEPVSGGIQVGPWFPQPWNLEQPYANLVRASGMFWYGDGWSRLGPEHIDRVTGLPKSLGGNSSLVSDLFFPSTPGAEEWDGDWVLRADCTGDVELDILFGPFERLGPCHLAFKRDFNAISKNHYGIRIKRLNGTISNLRLCRAEEVSRCDTGVITSSRFAEGVKGYTHLRFMDLQSATTALVQTVDDLATMQATQWGVESKALNGSPPFVGMPLEAPFRMAVETGTIAWVHWPITLGAPNVSGDGGVWRQAGKDNAVSILESPEWDRYADAFVTALIKSGYPEGRPLKVALANEVWNFSAHYQITTNYAWGVGEGLRDAEGLTGYEIRTGYGALVGRMREALNGALERANRKQAVEYVVESQAAWDLMSKDALRAVQWYVERSGEKWKDAKDEIGLSVASYWGADWGAFETQQGWIARISADPAGTMDAFEQFIMTDPANFGAKWVYTVIASHKKVADDFGIPLTGFYEGGSHLERPGYIPQDWYTSFLWGEHGGRINAAVNAKLRETYPDATLSNYALAGATGGQPWFDGLLSSPTPYSESWDQFRRKD